MIINQANIADLFVAYNAAFQRGFARGASEIDRVATVVPSTTGSEHYAWLGQWPKFREWVGDRVVKMLKSHDYTVKNKPFESTVAVSRDAIKDDTYGVYSPLFEEMGYAAAVHPTELVMKLLANGGSELCYDGQNFFDTDHPVENPETGAVDSVANQDMGGSGTTYYLLDTTRPLKPLIFQRREAYEFVQYMDSKDESVFRRRQYEFGAEGRGNAGFGLWQMAWRSNQDLTETNFDTFRAAMRNFKSDEGRRLGVVPSLIVCGASREAEARKLFKAERNANGSTNTLMGAVEILVSKELD